MSVVFNISQNKKKLKDLFVNRPTRPIRQNSGFALAVRVEHWTPKGDCTERGDKERSHQKKVRQKNG